MIEVPENDGFSSSDGEFETAAENLVLTNEIKVLKNKNTRLKNQITEVRKEKDEKIKDLLAKYEKDKIQMEEREAELKNILTDKMDENEELIESVNRRKRRFTELDGILESFKRRLEEKSEELRKNEEEKIKLNSENERLMSALNESRELSNSHDSQEQSQAAYGTLASNSTPNFNARHIVPECLTAKRHAYAKKLEFWDFDSGPLETTISKLSDKNYIGMFHSSFINFYLLFRSL